MIPEEIDEIIKSMEPVCSLCATMVDPAFGKNLCRDCWHHVRQHPSGMNDETTSATIADALGLMRGSKRLPPRLKFANENERMDFLEASVASVQKHSTARQRMLKARFCALYLPALVDELLTASPSRPFTRFRAFVYQLAYLSQDPFYPKFFLSDDPRAAGGNRAARVIADQLILHAPEWEQGLSFIETDDATYVAFDMLNHILAMQVDKPSASPLADDVKQEVSVIVARWLKRNLLEKETDARNVMGFFKVLQGDGTMLNISRDQRDVSLGLQECAREGCHQKDNLWLCARCGTVTYCGREHQREDWYAEPGGHRRICYKTWY